MAARSKQRLKELMARFAAVLVFVLAQIVAAAHAFECEDHADHEAHSCQICHLAERNDDALSPVQFSHAKPPNITTHSDLFGHDAVTEKVAHPAEARAPPLSLNEE